MAIDTAAKRGSMLNFGSGSTDLVPVPSGTVDQSERLTLLDLFSGMEIAEFLSQQRIWGVETGFSRGPQVADSVIEAPETTPWLATVGFNEPSRTASVGTVWPVTFGFPTGRGQIAQSSDLCCANSSGVPIPTQTLQALPWRPDRLNAGNSDGPRFTILDTQATFYGGGAEPTFQVHKGVSSPTHDDAIVVTETATLITVATGAITFTVSKSSFAFLSTLTASGTSLISGSSLYWTDTDGNEHTVTGVTVSVEKTGPLRAVVKAVGSYSFGGVSRHQFVLRIHAFAGLPYLKIHHTLVWDQNEVLRGTVSGTTLTTTIRSGSVVEHGWATGNEVKFPYCDNPSTTGTANDGTLPTALDSTTTFYIRKLTATTVSVHPTSADATNNTNAIDVATGLGSGHILYIQRQKPVLADYGLKFTIDGTVTQGRFDVEGAGSPTSYTIAGGQSCHAVQSAYATATLTAPGGGTTGETRLAGWADARTASGIGIAASVQDLVYAVPKKLLVSDIQLQVQFWGGATAMSMISEDRLPGNVTEALYNGGSSNVGKLDWVAQSGEANPFGTSRTHECWLWPAVSSAATNRLYNDLVQNPPTPYVDPDYLCGTDAIDHLAPLADLPAGYTDIADGLRAMHDFVTARDSTFGDMDFWTFGDMRLFRSAAWRTFDNGGYRGGIIPWKLFAASGERDYLIEGMRNARHHMDVDTVQISQTITPPDAYGKIAGRGHTYAVIHWGWPEVDNLGLYSDTTEQLLWCYCLTGYERAADVLDIKTAGVLAENLLGQSTTQEPVVGSASAARAQYGICANLWVTYQWTGDGEARSGLRRWSIYCRKSQLLSTETDAAGNQLMPAPNSDYHYGHHHYWLEAMYDLTGLEDAKDALLNLHLDYAAPGETNYTAPDFACTRPPYRSDRSRRSTGTLAFAYDRTGDLDYLRYAVERIRQQCLAVQRGGTYDGYSTLIKPLYPLFVLDALRVLKSWERSGYAALTATAANSPMFYSEDLDDSPYFARMTVYVMKEAGVAVNVRLVMKDSSPPYGSLDDWRIVVTYPDTSTTTDTTTWVAPNNYNPEVEIVAGDPAGQYKIYFDNKGGGSLHNAVFVACPKSDAASMVVELNASKQLLHESFLEPSRFFIKLASGQTAIAWSQVYGNWDNALSRPLTVLDENGELIDYIDYDNSSTTSGSTTIPVASRTEVISLLKGISAHSPGSYTSRPGITLGQCERYVAVTKEQWFMPS